MEGLRSAWSTNKAEIFSLLRLSIPVSANFLLNRLVGFTSVLFVGRLGSAELAAAALGGSLTSVVGLGVIGGLTGGMSTLCGQVRHQGMSNMKLILSCNPSPHQP